MAFIAEIVSKQPAEREIHIVLDNLSAHKTQRVRDFLEAHPNVQLHFTPTYSSWLNQVELWFARIERDMIYPGAEKCRTRLDIHVPSVRERVAGAHRLCPRWHVK